jgi:hypothetical protein
MSSEQNRPSAARAASRIIDPGLRTAAIRLAHENPGPVRDALLPILKAASMPRIAGEIRHVKDRAGDEKNFAWAERGPSERDMNVAFEFDPTKLKPLAKCLRATLMALGHSQSAYHDFTKLKSAVISPDGNLGGKGYIQRIAEMRRMYMNVSEALSALSDTIYDEINASHWNTTSSEGDPRERTDVVEIMDDVEEIKDDPEGFAEEIEEDMEGHGKTARRSLRQLNAAGSGAANAKYLDSLPPAKKAKILKHIAEHYGVSIREIEVELTDRDAEALYEYAASDRSMAMEILRDFKQQRLLASKTAAADPLGKAAKEVGKAVGMMDRAAKTLTGDRRSSVAAHEAWISVNHAAEVVANVHAEILDEMQRDQAQGRGASPIRVVKRSTK